MYKSPYLQVTPINLDHLSKMVDEIQRNHFHEWLAERRAERQLREEDRLRNR